MNFNERAEETWLSCLATPKGQTFDAVAIIRTELEKAYEKGQQDAETRHAMIESLRHEILPQAQREV